VLVLGTSRRRQTIGLIPSSQTFSCTTPFSSDVARKGGFFRDDRFGGSSGQSIALYRLLARRHPILPKPAEPEPNKGAGRNSTSAVRAIFG
jgi:hypothetical protein